MGKVTAVFLDTVSIQKYIFTSNSLKENLGASSLVERIFQEYLHETIEEICGTEIDMEAWFKTPETIQLKTDQTKLVEIGYIGGGNALLLFRSEDMARLFVRKWSLKLLIETPGLQTAAAIDDYFSLNPEEYQKNMERLTKSLDQGKNTLFPNSVLTKHGITADCIYSGNSAEVPYIDAEGREIYISAVSKAKRLPAENNEHHMDKVKEKFLPKGFAFPLEHEQLGQKEGKSYLAIVHIDGNGMGKRFMECKSLVETRKLSWAVRAASENAYKKLIRKLANSMEYFKNHQEEFEIWQDKNNRTILPLRPIVFGGDDITFVTDGRLGVYLAEKFMGILAQEPLEKVKNQNPIYTSAGVAVIKSRYPFYRGYQMAEELCQSAKKAAAKNPDSNWLDFYISQGGYSQALDGIRQKHYRVKEGSLNFGPYLVGENSKGKENTMINLKNGMNELRKWPRAKVKELRNILPMGKETTKRYLENLKARELILPKIEGPSDYYKDGWNNAVTPYFEMLELMEFYPEIDFLSEGELVWI